MISWITAERGMHYSRNGGKANAAATRKLYYVEGVAFTLAQLAEKMGKSQRTASSRVLALRRRGEPLTWVGLL